MPRCPMHMPGGRRGTARHSADSRWALAAAYACTCCRDRSRPTPSLLMALTPDLASGLALRGGGGGLHPAVGRAASIGAAPPPRTSRGELPSGPTAAGAALRCSCSCIRAREASPSARSRAPQCGKACTGRRLCWSIHSSRAEVAEAMDAPPTELASSTAPPPGSGDVLRGTSSTGTCCRTYTKGLAGAGARAQASRQPTCTPPLRVAHNASRDVKPPRCHSPGSCCDAEGRSEGGFAPSLSGVPPTSSPVAESTALPASPQLRSGLTHAGGAGAAKMSCGCHSPSSPVTSRGGQADPARRTGAKWNTCVPSPLYFAACAAARWRRRMAGAASSGAASSGAGALPPFTTVGTAPVLDGRS